MILLKFGAASLHDSMVFLDKRCESIIIIITISWKSTTVWQVVRLLYQRYFVCSNKLMQLKAYRKSSSIRLSDFICACRIIYSTYCIGGGDRNHISRYTKFGYEFLNFLHVWKCYLKNSVYQSYPLSIVNVCMRLKWYWRWSSHLGSENTQTPRGK